MIAVMPALHPIPVYRPALTSRVTRRVLEALELGEISGTAGHFLSEFEERFAAYCGCSYGISTSSGSTALHLAAVVLGIEAGDEVLVSAATNIATANAIAMQGGIVVPIDVEPDTWNLDPTLLERAVTERTRAIFPVHLYGHPVDMDAVRVVARAHHLTVVEDAAEAHGALYRGRRVGGLSDVGCFSFYANKVITTGEGGMLVTNRADLAERARSLRNLAFGEPRFLHQEIGFNYRMTNLQAAIGCAQLDSIEWILEAKRDLARRYAERLVGIPGLRLPIEREWARSVYWMFGLVVEPEFPLTRDALMERLAVAGIETRTMFCPLNLQPALRSRGLVRETPCPVAESLWERGMYLPSSYTLADDDLDYICDVIREAA